MCQPLGTLTLTRSSTSLPGAARAGSSPKVTTADGCANAGSAASARAARAVGTRRMEGRLLGPHLIWTHGRRVTKRWPGPCEFPGPPSSVRISLHLPPPQLRPWVEALWVVRGADPGRREQVLPNGAVELIVNLGAPHAVV